MAEQNGETTHIKCSQCKCQYISLDEHIKTDFGYSRLGKQYKKHAPNVEQRKRKKSSNQS
jgi:hypothetical protein